jgi:hypothetical protein
MTNADSGHTTAIANAFPATAAVAVPFDNERTEALTDQRRSHCTRARIRANSFATSVEPSSVRRRVDQEVGSIARSFWIPDRHRFTLSISEPHAS